MIWACVLHGCNSVPSFDLRVVGPGRPIPGYGVHVAGPGRPVPAYGPLLWPRQSHCKLKKIKKKSTHPTFVSFFPTAAASTWFCTKGRGGRGGFMPWRPLASPLGPSGACRAGSRPVPAVSLLLIVKTTKPLSKRSRFFQCSIHDPLIKGAFCKSDRPIIRVIGLINLSRESRYTEYS